MMVTVFMVSRAEIERARKAAGYLFIYGRRKVGKTYMTKNFLKYDVYFLVKRGGGVIAEGAPLSNIESFRQFLEIVKSLLKNEKTVVVDEFQRLPSEFLDHVQTLHPSGKLILLGSSFHTVKEVLSPRSPVLGLFSELKLSLISPRDIFTALSQRVGAQKAFELSAYLRDPWTLEHFRGKDTRIEDIVLYSKGAIRSLLGEVFLEEERSLSRVYEGIVRAIAAGKWRLKEVADMLYAKNLIQRADPSLVRPYFNNMEAMDLVSKIPLYKKNDFRYVVKSPIMEAGFFLDERFGLFEDDVSEAVVKDALLQKLPYHIELFCGQFFAELYSGRFEYFYSKDFDLDFVVTSGKKTLACGEVKWSSTPTKDDVYTFLERSRHIPGHKIFFAKKEVDVDGVISMTPEKILANLQQTIHT
jgi:AAA+ ATPase superfamily predicted ATPase